MNEFKLCDICAAVDSESIIKKLKEIDPSASIVVGCQGFCAIGAVIASFGLIFGAEYFIFALATKLICFILKETWFGWKIAFFAYLIVVILRTIYYIFHKETIN